MDYWNFEAAFVSMMLFFMIHTPEAISKLSTKTYIIDVDEFSYYSTILDNYIHLGFFNENNRNLLFEKKNYNCNLFLCFVHTYLAFWYNNWMYIVFSISRYVNLKARTYSSFRGKVYIHSNNSDNKNIDFRDRLK